MNLYDIETRRALCAALDQRIFEIRTHRKLFNAQANLCDRSHYCDTSTLRYFNARVTHTSTLRDGVFFMIVERTATDHANTRRGSRVVVFDLTGATVYRPTFDECSKTSQAAIKAFYQWWNTFDPVQHYARVLADKAARAQEQHNALRALADQFAAAAAAARGAA